MREKTRANLAPDTGTSQVPNETQSSLGPKGPTGQKRKTPVLKAAPVPRWQTDITMGRDQLWIVIWGDKRQFEPVFLFQNLSISSLAVVFKVSIITGPFKETAFLIQSRGGHGGHMSQQEHSHLGSKCLF